MSLIDFIHLAAQAQSGSVANPAEAPSPELLKAIADLMNAVAGHPPASSWVTPEGLEAVTGFIVALAWPLLVGVVIYGFRRQLVEFLSRTNKVKIYGVEVEIQKELNESAKQAAVKFNPSPSEEELKRAAKVAELAKQDVELVRQQVDALAIEYDNLRGLMPSGHDRTREMEKVISKMRAIGKAAYAIRYELTASPSPGRRLQAVGCLQVRPDYELLGWLAKLVGEEKPFVKYHALIALNVAAMVAARRKDTRALVADIKAASEEARRSGVGLGAESTQLLSQLQERIDSLTARAAA